MKAIRFFIAGLLACWMGTIRVQAQTNFVVNEIRQYMSKGEQTGFEVVLSTTTPDEARDAIERWMKKQKAKVTLDKKSPEMFVDNAMIPSVSANMIDLYVTTAPEGTKGSKLTVFADLGGAFISSAAYPQQYAAFEVALKKFAKDQAIAAVDKMQKEEEKILKTLQGNLDDLVKTNENYVKDIEKSKALIQQREQDILKNQVDQASRQQQISLQQQIIESVKQKSGTMDPALLEKMQKEEEKILKNLQGDLEDLVKDKKDYIKEIEKANALILQREQDIPKNQADQASRQQQISLQQQIIETIKQKRATLNY